MRIVSSGSVKVFYPLYSRDELIALLRERVKLLADVLPLRRVVLFGSWAKSRATAFSDVDLMVIYGGPPRENAYRVVCDVVDVRRLEAHVYAEAEAEAVGATLARMAEGGVVLFPAADPTSVPPGGPETPPA